MREEAESQQEKSSQPKMPRFCVVYMDRYNNQRNYYIGANNERDALVNTWLNNKHVNDIISVKAI